MDKKRKIVYALIGTAVDKGIRDIKENSWRGTRNLVDLGMHFSRGRFQKDFFRLAQVMLSNEECPYYNIVNYIANNTNPRIIKRFGINLCYNCWCYGAAKIKDYEKKNGYNIPWNIVFDINREERSSLSNEEISEILYSGESLGIFCGMFFINCNKEQLKSFIAMLKRHKYSSFFLFIQPNIIDGETSALLASAENIAVLIYLDLKNIDFCKKTCEILTKNKCLYGLYSYYNDDNLDYIMQNYISNVKDLHCTFNFFIREKAIKTHNMDEFLKFIHESKYTCKNGVLLFDFYEDLENVNRIMCIKNCFIKIKWDGAIAISTMNEIVPGLNIRRCSLNAVLEKTMPKIKYP